MTIEAARERYEKAKKWHWDSRSAVVGIFYNHVIPEYPLALDVVEAAKALDNQHFQSGTSAHCYECGEKWPCAEGRLGLALAAFEAATE